MTLSGRLILDGPLSGIENMSIDAAILQSLRPDSAPTLRFYRWAKPTLSLGYFQRLADRELHRSSQGIEIVRRATGGGAIVHHQELTYSIAISLDSRSTGAAEFLYRKIHDCFSETLCSFGIKSARFGSLCCKSRKSGKVQHEPFLCFQRRSSEDLIVSGYKVLGSAQRRGTSGVLQHGSLLLGTSEFAPELPGLLELSDRQIWGSRVAIDTGLREGLAQTIVGPLSTAISRELGIEWKRGHLSEEEQNLTTHIGVDRFGSSAWLEKR